MMSRWSTPKSYRKQRRDAYLSLDDEHHHVNGNQFIRAPRKMKLKTPHCTNTAQRTHNPIDSYSRSNCNIDSSESRRDAVVSRDPLYYYVNQTYVTNRNTKQKYPYSVPEIHSLNTSSYPHMNDSTIATRPHLRLSLPKSKSGEDYNVRKAFDEPIKVGYSHSIQDSQTSYREESCVEEERRDEVEQARFGIFEDRDREENHPFDEPYVNHRTNARKSTRAYVTNRATPILPLKPMHTPLRAAKVARYSTSNSLSKNRKSCRSSLRHDNREIPFRSFDTNGGLSSPPRVSRFSSTKGNFDLTLPESKPYPIQRRQFQNRSKPKPKERPPALYCHKMVGPASLGIHRLRLPHQYLKALEQIVQGCEVYAESLPNGWNTDLYSLTKQDIALSEIPELYHLARPIVGYMAKIACFLYGVCGRLTTDTNQPHVLKYTHRHKGVELHHDKCDITMNLMMSRSDQYTDGGTYFQAADTNVRLDFGEFLLHPGSAVHAGTNIREGTRILMVVFANVEHEAY